MILFISFPSALNARSEPAVPLFDLTFLVPNTNPARIQWAELIGDELIQIGIDVVHYNITGWYEIASRTWSYPFISFPYIPQYSLGGYDVLFVGWTWGLDLNILETYITSEITPSGDNFMQYSNSTFDTIYNNFKQEPEPTQRTIYAQQLQQILYEDLPDITIQYPAEVFGFKDTLTGIITPLLVHTQPRVEYWDDPDDHTIVYACPSDFYAFNCFRADTVFDQLWCECVYGALFKRNRTDLTMQPQIAESYAMSVDNLNISVDIDPNARFSNGDPVLAEDVKYTYELHMTPEVGSWNYWYFTSMLGSNESIEIVDTDTVKFCFSEINNYPLDFLRQGLIDKSVVEPLIAAHGYGIFDEMVGTGNVGYNLVESCGPFYVSSYSSSDVVLLPNPYWHGEPVSLTQLAFSYEYDAASALAALASGSFDILDSNYYTVPDNYTSLAGCEARVVESDQQQGISVNMRHPIIGTGELTPAGSQQAARYIRHAISHCIPRQVIIDTILDGLAYPGIIAIPDHYPGFDGTLTPFNYDIAWARILMELAGYTIVVIPEYPSIGLFLFLFMGVVAIYTFKKFKKK